MTLVIYLSNGHKVEYPKVVETINSEDKILIHTDQDGYRVEYEIDPNEVEFIVTSFEGNRLPN